MNCLSLPFLKSINETVSQMNKIIYLEKVALCLSTHLKFLLCHKVLHPTYHLNGRTMMFSQAVGKMRRASQVEKSISVQIIMIMTLSKCFVTSECGTTTIIETKLLKSQVLSLQFVLGLNVFHSIKQGGVYETYPVSNESLQLSFPPDSLKSHSHSW